jgi:conjugal transfer pilus assembly protein TraL
MNYRIPKTLDNSFRCLGIPMDTLIVFMMIWGSFMMFNKGLYGIPAGIIAANIFGRYRSRSIIRKIIRIIYWYLPAEMNFIKGVQGHQRQLNMKFKKQKNMDYQNVESK